MIPGAPASQGSHGGPGCLGRDPVARQCCSLGVAEGLSSPLCFLDAHAVKHSPGTSDMQADRGGLGTPGDDVPQGSCLRMEEL